MRPSRGLPRVLAHLAAGALAVTALIPAAFSAAGAQDTGQAPGASTPEARPDPFSISGILFLNYQYRTHPSGSANRFDVERAYLTARANLDDRTSIRLTTDIFQLDTAQRSWTVRAKYAWVQHEYVQRPAWTARARLGLIQTVFIEHDEAYWPRWLANTPTDRHGYFSSADAGIGNEIQLKPVQGEIYTTITNGPGFGSRETDRFKDYATRVTIRPFATGALGNPLRSMTLTAWGYKGAIASRFVRAGEGQLGPVSSSLARDRWGVFGALRHPRLTAAVQHARRYDEGETGDNTEASPRVITDSTGSISAAYAIFRPFGVPGRGLGRFAGVARFDRVTVNRSTGLGYDLRILGVIADFSQAASVSLDYQEQAPRDAGGARTRTYFLHFVARF